MNRGDIYLANLTLINESVVCGIGPVVVIQNNIENTPIIIIAPVTSKVNKPLLPTQVEISINKDKNVRKGVLLLEQIRTLDKNSLIQKIGYLSKKETINVNHALNYSFAIYRQYKNDLSKTNEADKNIKNTKVYSNNSKTEWKRLESIFEYIDLLPELSENVKDINTKIGPIIEKQKIAKGKFGEFSVIDYFKHWGYGAERAGSELDHLKIDIIAENETDIVFIQVKTGQVSKKEIINLVKCVSELDKTLFEKHLHFVATMCADNFPPDSEMVRKRLEQEFKMPIMLIHKYQILKICPEYKSLIN